MKIIVLTDDKVQKRGFLAEHGLSLFIEYKGYNILFDTGQSDVYIRNARTLKLDLNKTDCIVLSHGHYDHCGGIEYLPDLKKNPKIYLQKSAMQKKYAINPDRKTYREIGIPWPQEVYNRLSDRLILSDKIIKIHSEISLYGKIPSTVGFEDVPKGFFIKNDSEIFADMIKDEQMLIFDTENGLIIFLGCSHPGVINCLKYAVRQFPGKKIHTLVAGMHLDSVSPLRLEMTIQSMLDMDIQNILPLHCTGIHAIDEMKRFLGERCHVLYAGDSIKI